MGWNNCKNARTCGHSICFEKACKKYDPKETTQQTNADRIRAMSDEELAAKLIMLNEIDGDINFCKNLPECDDLLNTVDGVPLEKCRGCLLDWLRQPAEVE